MFHLVLYIPNTTYSLDKGEGSTVSKMNIVKFSKLLLPFLILSIVVLPAFAILKAPGGGGGGRAEIYVIGEGSSYWGSTGWFSGYVIKGRSGTYALNISVTGSQAFFPITDLHVVALISHEAMDGGLKSLSIQGMPIVSFQEGIPPYYLNGDGPFREDDYFGYNDSYVLPSNLTYAEAHWPTDAKEVLVEVEFHPKATAESKVAFICYGMNFYSDIVKTSFKNQTMFMIPEFESAVMGLTAMCLAFGIYGLRKHKLKFL